MQYHFIKDNLSIFSVEEMCECFGAQSQRIL